MAAPNSKAPPLPGARWLVLASTPVLLFLVLPSLVIVPMALTAGQLIQFPPVGLSIHSYVDYLSDPAWVASTVLSFKIAALAVAAGSVAGGTAAVALHGRRFRGRGALTAVILLPIVIPVVLLALGDYLLLAPLQLVGFWPAIGLADAMLVTPYVFLSAQTSLAVGLDPALTRSAQSLGAGAASLLRHVYWPAIRPGVLAGALIGFAVSFDEVVIAMFLQGPDTVTLPVRMYTSIQYELSPKIAASASLFLGLAILILAAQRFARR
jgi:putative spermidine/putrescine transport system permease protein